MEQSNRLYTDEFMQAFSQPIANVSYNQTEGTYQWQMARPEAQQAMEESVRASDAMRQQYQGLTRERIEDTFRELFYEQRQQRQRQIRIWPNRVAEYPLTPAEAFPVRTFVPHWSTERSNEPFATLEQMREVRTEHYSDRVQAMIYSMMLTKEKDEYNKAMREVEIALQKETNKASPYLDFDNY